MDIETRYIIRSRQRTTKVLIRLSGCAGGSAPLLFAYGTNKVSHDGAQIISYKLRNEYAIRMRDRNITTKEGKVKYGEVEIITIVISILSRLFRVGNPDMRYMR